MVWAYAAAKLAQALDGSLEWRSVTWRRVFELVDPEFDPSWEDGYADIHERISHGGVIEPCELIFPGSDDSWRSFHSRKPNLSLGIAPRHYPRRKVDDERERRIAQVTEQLHGRAHQIHALRPKREEQEAAARAWWLNHDPTLAAGSFLWIATLGNCEIGNLRLSSAYYFLPLPIADRAIARGHAIPTPNYVPPPG